MPSSTRRTSSALHETNLTSHKTTCDINTGNSDNEITNHTTKKDNLTNLGKKEFDVITHQPLPRKLTEVLLNR